MADDSDIKKIVEISNGVADYLSEWDECDIELVIGGLGWLLTLIIAHCPDVSKTERLGIAREFGTSLLAAVADRITAEIKEEELA